MNGYLYTRDPSSLYDPFDSTIHPQPAAHERRSCANVIDAERRFFVRENRQTGTRPLFQVGRRPAAWTYVMLLAGKTNTTRTSSSST